MTTPAVFKCLSKAIRFLKVTASVGLKYVFHYMKSVRSVVVTDASFENAKDLRSQLGFVVAMVDVNNMSNIVLYGSSRCRRVALSVMAAEVHGLVLGFDFAFTLCKLLLERLQRPVPMGAYVVSRTLFNMVSKDCGTTERLLFIDPFALRKSYEQGEISRLGWLPGTYNAAYGLIKPTLSKSSPLWRLMKTNQLLMIPVGWAIKVPFDTPASSTCAKTGSSECRYYINCSVRSSTA